MYSMIVPAYAKRYGVEVAEVKQALARIASKNHANGARNPRAQFRKEMSVEQLLAMPRIAGELSVFDCAGVADGAAAAVVVRAEDAHKYTDAPLYVKALSFVVGDGSGVSDPDYDYTTFPEVVLSAQEAYRQAGVTDPAAQLAMAEVHDCFTPTELVLMEDLGFCERGAAWKEELAGTFDLDGALPVNPDGGLKSFGHPVGATGLRMMFEAWLQLRGEAPAERRIADHGTAQPGPDPQPGRLPRGDGLVRLHPGHRGTGDLSGRAYGTVRPPSRTRTWPVMNDEASLARNSMPGTISFGSAMRCSS